MLRTANRRLARLAIYAAGQGLTPEPSQNVSDVYTVVLDGPQRRRVLLIYGDQGRSVDIFLVDDDAEENRQVSQHEARDMMREAGERQRRGR